MVAFTDKTAVKSWASLITFWLLALCCAGPCSRAAAASFTASLDRDTITAGESTGLRLTFEGVEPSAIPVIESPPHLSVQYQRESRQFSMINGRSSSSLSYEYVITATRAGEYQLGPFRAEASGQTLVAPAVRLKVLQGTPGGSEADALSRLAYLKLIVPKKTVYLGEVFQVEIQLYLGVNYDNVEMPQIQGDGFIFGKPPQPTGTRTQIGNRIFAVFPFKMSALAVKTGTLTLGPAQCSALLQIPVNRRSRDRFEDLFGPRVRRTPVTLASNPETITVLPLPEANRPPSFNGAVGSFSLAAQASPTNVTAGDPITLRVQIAGEGNLESLPFPAGTDWPGFKLYPPTSKVEPTDPLGLQGVKTFERVVIPQQAELRELPPIEFTFFDPREKAYRTVVNPAIPIQVRRSERGQPQPTVLAGAGAEPEQEPASRDIVPNKPYLGTLIGARPPLILRPGFLALQCIPPALWLLALLWRKRQDTLENNPHLRRRRAVAESVRRGVSELMRLAQANDSDAFFALVFRLLQEQLGERLDLPASAITESVLDERLQGHAPQPLLQQLHELFQLCNQARYAPHRSTQELMELVPGVQSALRALRDLPNPARA